MDLAVTRRIHADQIQRLRDVAHVQVWDSDLPPSPQELHNLLDEVDGALTLLTDQLDASFLDQHPNLRVISNLAVGYDNIDVPAATARGIAVCTTPDVLTDTTAEFTIALLFATARKIVPAARAAWEGDWKTWYPMRFMGRDLAGATFGVVGLGRIGLRAAELASALGMTVVYSDPVAEHGTFERVEVDELLARSDVVSLHTPLTPETRQLINANSIEQMKDDAILLNTGRGPLIDTEALVKALKAGKFSGVGLDVTDPEPLPAEHALYDFERVVVTPHIASASEATRHEMSRLAVENLLAVLQGGAPPNCLNPEVLAHGRT